MGKRPPLSRDAVVAAAVRVADREGLAGVSMRSVGREAGVEAMSLYHHVRSKDDLLDELADWVFTTIHAPPPGQPWREAMTRKATSARDALGTHPWALGLMESRRNPGPAALGHHDAVLGCLRANGFPVTLATHAFSVVDSYVYGFVLTEQNLPMDPAESMEEFVQELAPLMADYPHLAEMVAEQVVGSDWAYADEFGDGLVLILDGIERRLASA